MSKKAAASHGTSPAAAAPVLVIAMWPIDRPVPYPRNARKWSAGAIEKVANSIREFGWRQPLVCDVKDVIVIGHLRLAAAKSLGLKEVPVHVASDLTPAQIRGLRLADNRVHEEATWDDDQLMEELLDLSSLKDLDLSLTGFDTFQLDKFLKSSEGDDEKANACPEVPVAPVTIPGDLWLCGPHRVLCGDSTAAESVSRLLSGQKALFLMVTDPPYGVEYDPTWRDGKGGFGAAAVKQRGKVANDDRTDWREAYNLFPGAVAYVWHGGISAADFALSLLAAGFQIRGQIIWRKQQPVFSRGAYHWQHEPCWYAVRKGETAHWHGDRTQSSVWDVQSLNPTGNREEERVGHGTQKPIELMRRPILNHTVRGEAVYDPFLGSGTTLIAAEITGRICYGLEIDRAYCDVIVERWQKQAGGEATLESHSGLTFEHVKAGRRMQAEGATKADALRLIEERHLATPPGVFA